MFRNTKLITTLMAAALLATTVVSPAQAAPVVLAQGHADAFWIEYTGGALKAWVNDATVAPAVKRAPADTVLHVKPAAQTTVQNPANPSCLGTPGSPVWILPQVQNANLLWLGWDSNALNTGVFTGNQVTLKLHSVTGPGSVCVYSWGVGVTTLLNSGNGLPDTVAIPVDQHRHVNWAFTAAGTYTAVFEVYGTLTLGGNRTTGLLPYTFTVG